MIPILALTQAEFVDQMFQCLGRGRIQARICYREWMQQGRMTGADPAFANCPQLFKDIQLKTDEELPALSQVQEEGKTRKILLRTHDGLEVEAVSIPMQAGGTLCISSQVGCQMGCSFCETGRMGLIRNLTVAEIVAQVFVAKHVLGFEVRNIVFMGMGEPLDNFDSVAQAIRVLKDPGGFGYGRSHITVSTSGVVENIERLMRAPDLSVNLALSLNASNDAVRNRMMPINKRADMRRLREVMQSYCTETGRQILVAYVLIQGITDREGAADELVDYLDGLNVKVNVIPYNPQSKHGFQPPPETVVEAFVQRLRERGMQTLLRHTKGRDIMAACGQLGNLELRRKRFFTKAQ